MKALCLSSFCFHKTPKSVVSGLLQESECVLIIFCRVTMVEYGLTVIPHCKVPGFDCHLHQMIRLASVFTKSLMTED